MQGWITRKVSQISVLQQVSLGIGLRYPKLENTALTVTNHNNLITNLNGKLFGCA